MTNTTELQKLLTRYISRIITSEKMSADEMEIVKESVLANAKQTDSENEMRKVVQQVLVNGDVIFRDYENNRTARVRKYNKRKRTGGRGNIEKADGTVNQDYTSEETSIPQVSALFKNK